MKNQNKAYLYAVLAVMFWSTVATAFKIALQYIDFMQLLFISSFTSALFLFSIIIFKWKFWQRNYNNQSSILGLFQYYSITRADIIKSMIYGFLNPFLYYLVLFKAYSLLPAQEALTLNYSWAIIVVLLSAPVLKQKIRAKSLLALLVSFAGIIIIATKGDVLALKFDNPIGTAFAAGSSVIWAVYWVFNTKENSNSDVRLAFNFLFGFIYISILIIFSGELPPISFKPWIAGIYIGLFEMGITFLFWMNAMKLTSNTARIGNIVYLSPFLSLIIIAFVLHETIIPATFIGLLLIIAGIFFQRYSK